MKSIHLGNGRATIVSDEDFERVNQFKWYASLSYENKYYAKRKEWIKDENRTTRQGKYIKKGFYRLIAMHRFIMNAPPDMEVDHINGETLDNRRENLRLCTREQNTFNTRRRSNNKSGYKGVSWDSQTKKWRATITFRKKFYDLGRFAEFEDAVKARKEKASELFSLFNRS
jgi:hypothetical protein